LRDNKSGICWALWYGCAQWRVRNAMSLRLEGKNGRENKYEAKKCDWVNLYIYIYICIFISFLFIHICIYTYIIAFFLISPPLQCDVVIFWINNNSFPPLQQYNCNIIILIDLMVCSPFSLQPSANAARLLLLHVSRRLYQSKHYPLTTISLTTWRRSQCRV